MRLGQKERRNKKGETTKETDSQPEQPQVKTVGDSVKHTKWIFKLVDAKAYETVGSGMFKYTAEAGYVYVVLFFEVENVTESSQTFVTTWFSSLVNKGSKSPENLLAEIDGYKTFNTSVAASETMKGYLAWKISKQNFSSLEVTYKDLIQNGSSVSYDYYTFTVKPENVANFS